MDKIRPLAATWMDLNILILSQTEKDKYHMVSLNKFHLMESKK